MITNGTTTPGNQTKGKYKTATVGCSKPNFWNGVGADKIALMTVNDRMARLTIFHVTMALVLNFLLIKP